MLFRPDPFKTRQWISYVILLCGNVFLVATFFYIGTEGIDKLSLHIFGLMLGSLFGEQITAFLAVFIEHHLGKSFLKFFGKAVCLFVLIVFILPEVNTKYLDFFECLFTMVKVAGEFANDLLNPSDEEFANGIYEKSTNEISYYYLRIPSKSVDIDVKKFDDCTGVDGNFGRRGFRITYQVRGSRVQKDVPVTNFNYDSEGLSHTFEKRINTLVVKIPTKL